MRLNKSKVILLLNNHVNSRLVPSIYTYLFAVAIFFCSLLALFVNFMFYNFTGNNYFPDNMPLLIMSIILTNLGLILYYGKNSQQSRYGYELAAFFAVLSIIAFATNAIQLTPFQPIDAKIVSFELSLNIDLLSLMAWIKQYPFFKSILIVIYDSLPYQMCILPLILIALGRIEIIRDYYFMMLSTVFFGFLFYYFFPTTAPASLFNSPLFSIDQFATGIKFNQIHQHLQPTTIEGGLIAMPSFHVVWAILSIYLVREWLIPSVLLFIINTLLIASCVLLGWHYISDVISGLLLVALCYALLYWIKEGSQLNEEATALA